MITFNIMKSIFDEEYIKEFSRLLYLFRNNCIINYSPNMGALWDALIPNPPIKKHFTNLHDILITYEALKGIYGFNDALKYVEYLFSILEKDKNHPLTITIPLVHSTLNLS